MRQLRAASADLRTRTSETSLPRQVGPTRRLVVFRQPLDDLRDAGHALRATVNDLLLSAVSGGLRALLSARGDDVAALTVRTSVPAATGEGRQVSGIMLVDLPVGEPDPLFCLAAIHAATTRAKRQLYAGAGDISKAVHLPLPLARVGMRWMLLRRHPGHPVRQ